MTTQKSALDAAWKKEVAKSVLAEANFTSTPPTTLSRSRMFRSAIRRYGIHVLDSVQHLVVTIRDAIANIVTALAGSVLLLPVTIVVRGTSVLMSTLLSSVKDLFLSLARVIFEVVRLPFHGLTRLFQTFNKRLLFPVLKRVKEDDTFAVVALLLLALAIVVIYVVLSLIFKS